MSDLHRYLSHINVRKTHRFLREQVMRSYSHECVQTRYNLLFLSITLRMILYDVFYTVIATKIIL